MNITTQIIPDLSNGTKDYWIDLVTKLLTEDITIKDLRLADDYFLLSAGKDDFHNVKRGRAGYEPTRRVALALAKLQNIK